MVPPSPLRVKPQSLELASFCSSPHLLPIPCPTFSSPRPNPIIKSHCRCLHNEALTH